MASFPSYTIVSAVLMLRSIGLGNSYFPTRISESEVGGCSQNSEFSTWKYDISDFNGTIFPTGKLVNETHKYELPSPMECSINFEYTIILYDCYINGE